MNALINAINEKTKIILENDGRLLKKSFFGLLLIYTFNVIAISAIIYLLLLPISFFHYQKLKKHHENDKFQDDDDLEDVL